MTEPNYSKYTLDELINAYSYIDKVNFPNRVRLLKKEIELRRKEKNSFNADNRDKKQIKDSKSKTIFEKYKITDKKSCEKAIRNAFIASLIFTLYMSLLTFLAIFDIHFFLNERFSAIVIPDVLILAVLSYMIYKKSKFASWILLGYLLATYIYGWIKYDIHGFGVLDIALIYFIQKGGLATYKYYKLNPPKIEEVVDDRKECPLCKELNHKANIRCGCGYEFETQSYNRS